MKNYILTFVLAVLVVLTSVSLRRVFATNGTTSNDAATLVAIGPAPAPIPPSVSAIGPAPAPIPPSAVSIGPAPAPIPPNAQ